MRAFLVLLILYSSVATAQLPVTKWKLDLPAPAAAPTLYPDAARPAGLAVVSDKSLMLLNGMGQTIWRQEFKVTIATPATVADIDADGAPELLVLHNDGTIRCLDKDGRTRWTRQEAAPGQMKTVAAADVHPTPGLETLASFENGWVCCLDKDGAALWRFFGDKYRTGAGFAIGDADADGAPEIIYGTDNGHVYCLDGGGRVKWRYYEYAPYGRSGPNLADVDGDGHAEVYITRSNIGNATCLLALDGVAGAFMWRTQDMMQGYCSNATCDIDLDNKLEIVHGDKGNYLYCERSDGMRKWQAELGGNGLFWAPCAADVDGDDWVELIAGVRGTDPATKACVYVVGATGLIEHRLAIGGGANAAPAVGDIDGDGNLEVVVALDNPNELQVLSWNKPGRVAWPSLRGSSQMTANGNVPMGTPSEPTAVQPLGEGRLACEPLYLGDNQCRFSWQSSVPENSFVEVSVKGPANAIETQIVDLPTGAIDATLPVRVEMPGETEIAARLWEMGQLAPRTVAKTILTPIPFDAQAVRAAEENSEQVICLGKRAKADTTLLELRLDALRVEKENVSEDPDAATALRRDLSALERLRDNLGQMWSGGKSERFTCGVDENPWDNVVPEPIWSAEKPIVKIDAFQNESEDAAVTLMNVTGDTIDARCTFNEPDLAGRPPKPEPELAGHVTLRRAVPVGTAQGDAIPDALPELDLSRSMTLPPGEPRQLWLTVDTRALDPGKHQIQLYISTLTQPVTVQQVSLEIEVWPVALPDDVFAKINWSSFNKPEVTDQQVQDMLDHRLSVIYGPPLPAVAVSESGEPAAAPDWTAFDDMLARVPKHFFMLWSGPPACAWPGQAPAEDSDAYDAGYKTAIGVMAAHLAENGFPWEQWAFYPVDEPWNTGFTNIPSFRRFCERVKKLEPRAQIYSDPTGLVRVEYVEEFKDLVDVWQPEINVLKRDPELAEWFRKNAKRLWVYEAPGEAKHLLPLGHYRAQAWLAWKLGAQGAGFWVYKGEDNWWPHSGGDYAVVYQANGQVVPSRRWQASRDGVEDYCALYLLRQAIDAARQAGGTQKADEAQALLDEAVQKVAGWQIGRIDEITSMTRDYEIDFSLLNEYRHKIAAAILK